MSPATDKLLLIAIVGLLIMSPLDADQTDPRLDLLFEQLKLASDHSEARQLESQIWRIWIASGDPRIDRLMQESHSAVNSAQHTAAIARLDEVVTALPSYAEGWNVRATTRYLMGDHAESLADIEVTLKLEPRHFGALSGRGLCYSAMAELELALQAFEAALQVNPWLPGVHINAEQIRQQLLQQRRPI